MREKKACVVDTQVFNRKVHYISAPEKKKNTEWLLVVQEYEQMKPNSDEKRG